MGYISYCLEDIVVSFKNDNRYDLATSLSSNKITVDDLLRDYNDMIENDGNDSVIYKYDNYSILVCDMSESNKVVIGNNKLTFDNVKCD